MVVFVDLETLDVGPGRYPAGNKYYPFPVDGIPAPPRRSHATSQFDDRHEGEGEQDGEEPPNRGAFSAALASYPIIAQIGCHLDLNDLHSLANTCHQFRANILPFRHRLVKQSLKCEFAMPDPNYGPITITREKPQTCALDMVAECGRCRRIVCRNCITKTAHLRFLYSRHRRLCGSCQSVPLVQHPSFASSTPALWFPVTNDRSALVLLRRPCSCAGQIWFCVPCARKLEDEDVRYDDLWNWRERSSVCLGLMGIGEGIEGVHCARGSSCSAAKIIFVEAGIHDRTFIVKRSPTCQSYQVEKIGRKEGHIGMKPMKEEKIGAIVARDLHHHVPLRYLLEKEVQGEQRSWCGWCDRVILSEKEDRKCS